jgi:hypothetical protein
MHTLTWERTIRHAPGAILVVFACLAATPVPGGEPGLAVLMERMQTYTHKLQLSIEARNAPLADFYLHELEETSEFVAENIEHYHDYPVGEMIAQLLLPVIEHLEDAVGEADWAKSDHRFGQLLEACNACHLASGQGAIRIAPAQYNPFAQDFSVPAD